MQEWTDLRLFGHVSRRRPLLWPGFNRFHSLTLYLELFGYFDGTLVIYRDSDSALRGDVFITLSRLDLLLEQR